MKLDIIIVTFNRLEKLKKTLSCYQNQTWLFRNLIVVNNHSTDGTGEFLDSWKTTSTVFAKHVINTSENLGGSGGFYEGQKYAMTLNPDWIFLGDDDAYPDEDMIEKFNNFINTHDTTDVSAICASVLNPNRSICLSHRANYSISKTFNFRITPISLDEYKKEFFELSILSYVGPFIKCEVIKKVGMVNSDYFIYADDVEHGLRLGQVGKIVCVPSMKIVHDSGEETDKNNKELLITWRNYYGIRNHMVVLMKYFPRAVPRALYQQVKFIIKSKREVRMLYITAIKNAFEGHLGMHPIYKPGWAIKSR